MKIKDFIIGESYTNKQISETFKVSLMRGMARSNKKTGTDSLVLISKHVAGSKNRNPYEDKWVKRKLHYTGEGRIGNQSLTSGQNRTLVNSSDDTITVYLFEVWEQGVYIYRGIVELRDEPYDVYELDANGNNRKVWKFPLTVVLNESTTDKSLTQRIE